MIELGDIYYSDYLGFHILIIEKGIWPEKIEEVWWTVFVFEEDIYTTYTNRDIKDFFEKVA